MSCAFAGAARKVWQDYFPAVDGVIFIVDAVDRERFPEARKELEVRWVAICLGLRCGTTALLYVVPIVCVPITSTFLFCSFVCAVPTAPRRVNDVCGALSSCCLGCAVGAAHKR